MTAAVSRLTLPALDRNGWFIVGAKSLRSFAFGLSSVALGLYLSALRLAPGEVGLVLSAGLLGTALLTLVIALWGDRIGRRRLLVTGSALMALPVLFPFAGRDVALLAAVSLVGVVAVTGHENSGLQSVDQAVLAGAVSQEDRTAAFALYNLAALGAVALGALAAGLLPSAGALLGLGGASVHLPSFVLYAFAGLGSLGLASRLDPAAEVTGRIARRLAIDRSRGVVARLSALFALDAFAGGLAVHSFVAYWFATRHAPPEALVGALFFAGNVLTALSFAVAPALARRIGLVRTMVYTHIPANLCLIGMVVAPALPLAALLFLVRSSLTSMDVPARQSYTMAVVDPSERTAAAGLTSLARSGAQMPAPAVASLALVPLGLGVPLIAAGVLKIAYDLALFGLFRSRPAPEEVRPPAPGGGPDPLSGTPDPLSGGGRG